MRPQSLCLAVALLVVPGASWAQRADDIRADLMQFERALDSAVSRVSRPGPLHAFGAVGSSRGYYIKGYGAVFVLPPRALPTRSPRILTQDGSRDREIQRLERSLARVKRGDIREVLERSLAELHSAGEGDDGQLLPQAQIDEAISAELLEGMRELRERARRWQEESSAREQRLRNIEEQAEAFQREADAMREEAERQMDRVLHELRIRLAPPEPALAPTDAPASPPPPSPPEPPQAPRPPAAPWRTWIEIRGPEEESRSAQAVIGDVQGAVTAVLEEHATGLRILGPEEFVVVAVDFVGRGAFATPPKPQRTLLLRVKKKELEAGRSGRIPAEELQRRIEVLEY